MTPSLLIRVSAAGLFCCPLLPNAVMAAPPEPERDSAAVSYEQLRAHILEWRKTLNNVEESAGARKEAAGRLSELTDERAIPILMELWKKEESPQQRKLLVSGLESIGTRKAFNELVKISCEDANFDVRAQAARWIAKQDNREDAIPQFVKYLKGKKYFRNALTSLGYTEIAKKASRPDPELVAALIDNLITATPKRTFVPVYREGRWRYRYPVFEARGPEVEMVPVVTYEKTFNKEVKSLLYEYTSQDFEYDQTLWRQNVLRPLQKETKAKQ